MNEKSLLLSVIYKTFPNNLIIYEFFFQSIIKNKYYLFGLYQFLNKHFMFNKNVTDKHAKCDTVKLTLFWFTCMYKIFHALENVYSTINNIKNDILCK